MRTSSSRQAHPAGADRSDQPLLAPDQVLAVSAARPRDARRLPRARRRGGDRRRARRSRSTPTTRPTWCVIQVYITNAYRAYRLADHYRARGVFVALGGLHVTSLPGRSGARTPTRSSSVRASRRFRSFSRTSAPARRSALYRSTAGRTLERAAADPPRSDRPPPLSRAQLHRRHARLPAALRLLLQGRVLRGRAIVLHAARRRRARRDRAAARPASLFPRRSSARRPRASRAALFDGHARHEPAVSGRGDGRFDPARRSHRAGRGGRPAQPLRRLRDA